MNEPIISPWVFYFISIANSVCFISLALMVLSGIATVFVGFEYLGNVDDDVVRAFKKTLRVLMLSILVFVVTPTQETIYKMLISSYITPQNIEIAKGSVVDAVDAGVDKLIKIIESFEK